MKLNDARKKGAQNLAALTIIAVCVYLGFKPLTEFVDDPVSSGIVAASLGAAFVIIITMYLLNKQTEIEQESKQGEKLFEEKRLHTQQKNDFLLKKRSLRGSPLVLT